MTLSLRALTKSYAGRPALADVSVELAGGEYTCLMGASGSGKTTLLRLVAGLERQDGGSVQLDGRPLDPLPAERRPIHTLFQDYALFPHLSVGDNVGFALRLLGVGPAERTARVRALLADVGLDMSFETRKPTTLSGGEQQRVALARALAGEPRGLLLDEPLAALDRPLRAGLRRLLRGLTRRRGLGCLHVTHDPEEALALADRLLVFGGGALLAAGAPAELYARPPSLTVARLLGEVTEEPGGPGWLRPEHLRLGDAGAPGTVRALACLGDRWEVEVEIAGRVHLSRTAAEPACAPGDPVRVAWDPDRVLRFAAPRA
jgi:ABC-type Fe3+/spermidine/putrescine transport system ATPase subunit